MLRLVFDIYSGRPNPEVIVHDEAEAAALMRELSKDRALMSDGPAADAGLGFRGVSVEALDDDSDEQADMASSFYVPAGAAGGGKFAELLDRLIGTAQKGAAADSQEDAAQLLPFLRGQLSRGGRITATDSAGTAAEAPPAEEDAAAAAAAGCTYEMGRFNPGFWNNNPTIRGSNNCYNYASNKRTNTFAQPGRGCGQMYTAITCPEVTRASLCDGLHRRFHCFPPSEKPRYLVALVVAPGPGFVDFHWYRKHKEGFWGHKPGGTAARNTDNSNKIITNPQTCDRGPYTHFCGYFYTCRSQKIN
jgi:hypothetical protein